MDFVDPDATTVALDDVVDLQDFDDNLAVFLNLGVDAANFSFEWSEDSGYIGPSQELTCPCCRQELDDIDFY